MKPKKWAKTLKNGKVEFQIDNIEMADFNKNEDGSIGCSITLQRDMTPEEHAEAHRQHAADCESRLDRMKENMCDLGEEHRYFQRQLEISNLALHERGAKLQSVEAKVSRLENTIMHLENKIPAMERKIEMHEKWKSDYLKIIAEKQEEILNLEKKLKQSKANVRRKNKRINDAFKWQAVSDLDSLLQAHEWIDGETLMKISDYTLEMFIENNGLPNKPGLFAYNIYTDFVASATYYYDKMKRENLHQEQD